LRIRYSILYPMILLFCILGVYAINSSVVDVCIATLMGLLGCVLRKFHFEPAPIIIGLVLGPMIEMSLRQSLTMSDGSYAIFIQRPISATLVYATFSLILLSLRSTFRGKRQLLKTKMKSE
jgi:putative tricarboxylic transport membrane protein